MPVLRGRRLAKDLTLRPHRCARSARGLPKARAPDPEREGLALAASVPDPAPGPLKLEKHRGPSRGARQHLRDGQNPFPKRALGEWRRGTACARLPPLTGADACPSRPQAREGPDPSVTPMRAKRARTIDNTSPNGLPSTSRRPQLRIHALTSVTEARPNTHHRCRHDAISEGTSGFPSTPTGSIFHISFQSRTH